MTHSLHDPDGPSPVEAKRRPRAKSRGKPKAAAPFVSRPHPHLYEINAWVWLEELSARHGRRINIGSVPGEEWDALAALGFDYVWLMGVWKRSPASRKIALAEPSLRAAYDAALPGWSPNDVAGSPYSIHAYTPDRRIGAWKDLDAARAQLRRRGLGLILDFVPNHTAIDHPWTRAQPDFYVQGTLGDFKRDPASFLRVAPARGSPRFLARGRDPYFPAWTDTAQLNYFNPELRAALLKEIRSIAAHCDGLRCDMAMLVLNDVFVRTWEQYLVGYARPATEFWPEAVAAAPGLVFLAEVYWDHEWTMHQLGFHFAYDKRLYDRLCHHPGEVRSHLQAEWDYQSKLARFLENHDEPRATEVFGLDRLEAPATLIATLPGMRFYHQGQLDGVRRRWPVQLGRVASGTSDPAYRSFYTQLLALARDDAFHSGDWRLLEVDPCGDATSENLIACRWRAGAAYKLVVVNLGSGLSQGHIPLREEFDLAGDLAFHDQLHDATYERRGEDLAAHGLYVRLEPYRAHLFDVRPL